MFVLFVTMVSKAVSKGRHLEMKTKQVKLLHIYCAVSQCVARVYIKAEGVADWLTAGSRAGTLLAEQCIRDWSFVHCMVERHCLFSQCLPLSPSARLSSATIVFGAASLSREKPPDFLHFGQGFLLGLAEQTAIYLYQLSLKGPGGSSSCMEALFSFNPN